MREKFLWTANWIVRVIGGGIFIILSWYAFRYTQYMNPGADERPLNVHDSMLKNLLVLFVAVAIYYGLTVWEKRISLRTQEIAVRVTLAVTMVWIGLAGIWWICATRRVPEGDQAYLYAGASYFIEGNYDFLNEGSYFGMFPYQLGLTALMEVFFRVVGKFNYFAYQWGCVALSVGMVYLGFHLVKKKTQKASSHIMYCLFMLFCLPLVFYSGWVYGDIPSIFCMMFAADFILQYMESGKNRDLVLASLAVVLAMLVRKNSLIFLIALCIAGVVYAVWKSDRKIVLAIVIATICSQLFYAGIYKMYEVRSGYEHSKGIPMTGTIAMGMQETNGLYGWYNNYFKQVYYENNFDKEVCADIFKQEISQRMEVFRQNPAYTWIFYREKVLSQWNEPLYQSLYFSNRFPDWVPMPTPDTLAGKVIGEYFLKVLALCDRLQFLIYVGMACYFIFAVRKDSNILHHLLAITMIGGFFFSILWEAKARYILPYYITMFPCAVIGYEGMLQFASGFILRYIKRRGLHVVPDKRKVGKAA